MSKGALRCLSLGKEKNAAGKSRVLCFEAVVSPGALFKRGFSKRGVFDEKRNACIALRPGKGNEIHQNAV